jgi:hypothetical protein
MSPIVPILKTTRKRTIELVQLKKSVGMKRV